MGREPFRAQTPVTFPDGERVLPSKYVVTALADSLAQANLRSSAAVPRALRAIVLQQAGASGLDGHLSSAGSLCFGPPPERVRPALISPAPSGSQRGVDASGDIGDLRAQWMREVVSALSAERGPRAKRKSIRRLAAEKAGVYDAEDSSSSSDDGADFVPYFARRPLRSTLGAGRRTIDELQTLARSKTEENAKDYYRVLDSLLGMGSSPYLYGIGGYDSFFRGYCKARGGVWIGHLARRRSRGAILAPAAPSGERPAPILYDGMESYCAVSGSAREIMCAYAMGVSAHDNCQRIMEILCGEDAKRVQAFYAPSESVGPKDRPLVALAKFLESHQRARAALGASVEGEKGLAGFRGSLRPARSVPGAAPAKKIPDALESSLLRLLPASGPVAPSRLCLLFDCDPNLRNVQDWSKLLNVLRLTGCVSYIFTQGVVFTPQFLTGQFLSKYRVEFIQFSTFDFAGERIPTIDSKLGTLRAVREYRLARHLEEERRARMASGEDMSETPCLASFRAIIRHMATGGLQRQVLSNLLEWQARKMAENGADGNQNRMATEIDGVDLEGFEADMRDMRKHKKLLLPFYTNLEEFLREFFNPEAVLGGTGSRERGEWEDAPRLIETAVAGKGRVVVYVPCLYTEVLSLIDLLAS